MIPFGPDAGQQIKRLIDPDLARAAQSSGWGRQYVPPPLVVNSGGFSLHAATLVRRGQRELLEKLCRCVTRPALSLKRLEVRDDGMILWTLPRARRDGTRGFVMTPYQLLARLASLIPHPREHGLTYQGILAPASPLRDQVVPRPVVRKEVNGADAEADADGKDAMASSSVPAEGRSYIRWADWLRRVFGEDVLSCPRCKGRRHMISVITDPATTDRTSKRGFDTPVTVARGPILRSPHPRGPRGNARAAIGLFAEPNSPDFPLSERHHRFASPRPSASTLPENAG
ncbi:Putative transposase [Planctomycetes bacterium Poly30]|uniref:Transposase n=2 Tax=Saltatorellus ferox TaxID=2528018 RepID=A0A518EP65_9BACT|nr:Putative transposase [Planctomycetes bacterium Poly30]